MSIIVMTAGRPEEVEALVPRLAEGRGPDREILIVDVSRDPEGARALADRFPDLKVLHVVSGKNDRRRARLRALEHAVGEVVAFVDDDVVPGPEWLEHLLAPYARPEVVGVGGPVTVPGDVPTGGLLELGRLLPDGELGREFAIRPDRPLLVEHLAGSNMSFRRAALPPLAELEQTFPGTQLYEDTDLCLRTGRGGGLLVFEPGAWVARPRSGRVWGRRTTPGRWTFYEARNHVKLLADNRGLLEGTTWAFLYDVWRTHRYSATSVATGIVSKKPPWVDLDAARALTGPALPERLLILGVEAAGLSAGLGAAVLERASKAARTR